MPHCNDPPAAHVLAFAQTLKGGGVERALLRLAGGWAAAGRRVTLAIGCREGPLAAELPAGVTVRVLGDTGYRALASRLPRIVRETAPDLIFCPGNHYTGAAAMTRWRLGKACPPIVAKVSNALARPEQGPAAAWGYRRWLRLHPRFVDHLVAMSPNMAAETIAEMRPRPDRVSVIPNPPAMPIAGAPAIPLPAPRFILGVGRLEPQKRWDRLIAALPRLADNGTALVILGEGSQRAALAAQAAALGVAARVSLPGYAADPLPALAQAAVVALTSDFEGVPGVLREALSVGTPVVATEASVAVREIVRSPALGSVVPRDDGAALVAALDHWLAPGAARPAPVAEPGDAVAAYLALFDDVVRARAGPDRMAIRNASD
jgi:glycosyltransferase involved in cell wall biosynthesis